MNKKTNFEHHLAAIWRAKKEYLKPVEHFENITFDDLVGIERQKKVLIENSERFLAGLPSNNILLWGARGTGYVK